MAASRTQQYLAACRLHRLRRPFARIDDAWWHDVLYDPRARVPTETSIPADGPHARYRLDHQPLLFTIACHCGQPVALERDGLIRQVGGNINVIHLARQMIDRGRRNKIDNYCKAYVVR